MNRSEIIQPPRPRLLLVDDHEDTRRLLLLALELEGYEVVEAATAESGLSMLEQERFDLLLSDYCLPGHSGGWLLARATGRRLLEPGRALVLTAHPDPQGVAGFHILRKPFELDELFSTIANLLREGAATVSRAAQPVELVMYVSSMSWQSLNALRRLEAALSQAGPASVQLTVHDLARDPGAGAADRVTVTPTLVRRSPAPRVCILGDFSDPTLLTQFLEDASLVA